MSENAVSNRLIREKKRGALKLAIMISAKHEANASRQDATKSDHLWAMNIHAITVKRAADVGDTETAKVYTALHEKHKTAAGAR